MYQHPRMTMMGQSDIGPVPGSIPINYQMGNPTLGTMGMKGPHMSDNHATFTGVPMSDNHDNFTHKTHHDKMSAQQHFSQHPVRKEIDDEGRICGVVLPKPTAHFPTEENDNASVVSKENNSAQFPSEENDDRLGNIPEEKIKTEEEEDISNFMDTAHDIFLKISSKELKVKEASELLGRPYSFVYSRYQEFLDNITGTVTTKTKKKGAKTKKNGKKQRKTKRKTSSKRKSRTSGKVYQCEDCPAIFHSEWTIKAHSKVHTGKHESHVCTACGIVFAKIGQLMTHRVEVHEDALQCPHCDKQFTVITSYKFHVKSHTKARPFVCEECGKGFFSKFNLQGHYRKHTGERPFMCGFCEKTFMTLNILKTHMYVHTGRDFEHKKYECPECGRRYKSNDEVEQHMNTHTGAKPFACDQCDNKFRYKANLDRHKMTHTGVQPFKCNYCPAAFYQHTDLQRHTMAHTGDKPFKCDLCDYSCERKTILQYHKNTHTGETPYKCDFNGCSAEYTRPSSLQYHKLQHYPAPLKTCKVCKEQFQDLNSLKRHMMIHPGNKPVPCDQCDKIFYNESTLKRHMHVHMYKPPGQKTKQVIKRRRNPGIKRAVKPAQPSQKKLPSEYQIPAVAENGHNSIAHSWSINAEHTNSQQPYSFPTNQFTNMVNNPWPSTIDPDELRHRLLSSFK